ncbi:ATPase [Candidatus Vallotia lariciata]|uniref:ATPase n=1 Tax=Candidatus Vallotia laricis TaxID=2018052 RepID=UPI001D02CD5E|nr:ATPase [Candidatus Vallotia lariciata]UDG82894.1 hypothetical protein GKR41_00249 [Candidatus Vallotia lariciata]
MLTELKNLSQNIDLLIEISDRNRQAHLAVKEQLEDIHLQQDALRVHLEQVQRERDILSEKIVNTQVRLHSILEKLSHIQLLDTVLDIDSSQTNDIPAMISRDRPPGEGA